MFVYVVKHVTVKCLLISQFSPCTGFFWSDGSAGAECVSEGMWWTDWHPPRGGATGTARHCPQAAQTVEGQRSTCLNTRTNYRTPREARSLYFISLNGWTFGFYRGSSQLTCTGSSAALSVFQSLKWIFGLWQLWEWDKMKLKIMNILWRVLSTIFSVFNVIAVFSIGHPRWGAISSAPSQSGRGAKSSGYYHRGLQSRVGQRNASPVGHLHQWTGDQRAQSEIYINFTRLNQVHE